MKEVTYIQQGLLFGCDATNAEYIHLQLSSFPKVKDKSSVEDHANNRVSFLITSDNKRLGLVDFFNRISIRQTEKGSLSLAEIIVTLQKHDFCLQKTSDGTISVSNLKTGESVLSIKGLVIDWPMEKWRFSGERIYDFAVLQQALKTRMVFDDNFFDGNFIGAEILNETMERIYNNGLWTDGGIYHDGEYMFCCSVIMNNEYPLRIFKSERKGVKQVLKPTRI